MQVLSRQRDVSLIGVRRPGNAGGRPSAGGSVWRRERGFTLVELMITMAVALVLIMIAVPSFKNITLSNKLTTTANDLVGSINLARMEAIRRNASTQLCGDASNGSDALGIACVGQTGAVYAMAGGLATPLRAGVSGITTPIQLTGGNMAAIRFGGQGLGHAVNSSAPFTGLVADISTDAISTSNHRCINMTAGSIIATTTTTGACP
jgi:type IV fimbrial biogenesis protein FimT